VLVAVWTDAWLSTRLSSNGFVQFRLTIDWRVLSFSLVQSLLTGCVFGLAPAWLVSRVRVSETLKVGTRGSTGDRVQHLFRHGLIVVQFANALILLAGAGFVIKGIDKLLSIDPGWNYHSLAEGILTLPQAKYTTQQQTYSFYTRLEESLSRLPDAENVTIAWTLPISLISRAMQSPPKARSHRRPTTSSSRLSTSNPPTSTRWGVKLIAGRDPIIALRAE